MFRPSACQLLAVVSFRDFSIFLKVEVILANFGGNRATLTSGFEFQHPISCTVLQ